VVATVSLVVVAVAWSVIGAATTSGNESFNAKWADWMRSHHAGSMVGAVERWYYTRHAPPKGGQPRHLNSTPATAPGSSSVATRSTGHHLPSPAPVALVTSNPLPGEGQWAATGPLVDGAPGMYVAQFRADNTYTSQITSAVWIDPTRLHIALRPGAKEPGGTWSVPPMLSGTDEANAVAAFNGGFRFQDAHGGFYDAGREAVPLQRGAASMVIDDDGSVHIGTWGREVTMGPHVASVLQNLVLMVDGGQPSASAVHDDNKIWGATLGAKTVVARSGIGVTADGALVYVAGPALSARTLAEALQRAGAVRAMALDLNPEWVTFDFYEHQGPGGATVTGRKLYPSMQRPATRYLGPTPESRDFFTVSLP
jgi:hypothetical protein